MSEGSLIDTNNDHKNTDAPMADDETTAARPRRARSTRAPAKPSGRTGSKAAAKTGRGNGRGTRATAPRAGANGDGAHTADGVLAFPDDEAYSDEPIALTSSDADDDVVDGDAMGRDSERSASSPESEARTGDGGLVHVWRS